MPATFQCQRCAGRPVLLLLLALAATLVCQLAAKADGGREIELDKALAYVVGLEGVPYGWWTGGAIPAGAPAWANNAPAPAQSIISSAFCAAIPNLMLRVVGGTIPCLHLAKPDPQCGQCCGGTGAYGRNFSHVATPFDITRNYSKGTLVGRRYSGVHDQGHVAVLLGEGRASRLLQSYSDCKVEPCPIVTPGVNANLTLEAAYSSLFFANFTYAVAPEDWLVSAEAERVFLSSASRHRRLQARW